MQFLLEKDNCLSLQKDIITLSSSWQQVDFSSVTRLNFMFLCFRSINQQSFGGLCFFEGVCYCIKSANISTPDIFLA